MKPTDYPVFLVYSKEDESWLARVDLLPGCIADGSTQEEALANARKAIETWIEVSTELGRPIPKALDMQEIEEFQLKAMEQQGQQIQQLIQQAVAQVIQQFQTAMSSAESGTENRFPNQTYLFPASRVTNFTAVA